MELGDGAWNAFVDGECTFSVDFGNARFDVHLNVGLLLQVMVFTGRKQS
jgi:hypothetical protein